MSMPGSADPDRIQPAARPLIPAEARAIGDLIFTGGVIALSEDGTVSSPGDVRNQARLILQRIASLVASHGGTLRDVSSLTSFHADPRSIDDVLEVTREFFPNEPPAYTQVGFVGCQRIGALVMMRAIAHVGAGKRESITPDSQAWRRSYPMAAACRKGSLLFIAGQTGMDREGRVEQPFDHCRQARAAYDRIIEILELEGGTIEDVLDFTSFHHDIRGAIATLEDVYMPQVIGPVPAERAATTSHIGATGLLHPGVLGAYSAIADLHPSRRVGCMPEMVTWNDNGRYPIAGAARKEGGRLITVAGQVSSGPDGKILHPGDSEAQLDFIFTEIRASLEGVGATMRNIAEVCSFHKDPRSWESVMRSAGNSSIPMSRRPGRLPQARAFGWRAISTRSLL